MEHADLRYHYARLAQNPYTHLTTAKSSQQNATYLRSLGSGSSPKPTVASTAAAQTNQYLRQYKQHQSTLMSASMVNLSSAGPLTQSTVDRRQPML